MNDQDKTKDVATATNENELLQDPEVQEFLKKNEGCRTRVENAAKELQGKPDGSRALRKSLPALRDGKIKVFFSYKKKDEATAEVIVSSLRTSSANKLDVTYQADFGKDVVGRNWREWIKKNVRAAHWFILLLPDPSEDYDWCLFETGEFEAVQTSADRLICLHHLGCTVPDAIRDYYTVSATMEEVEKFLTMVYLEPNAIPGMEPLNKAVGKNIPAMAKEIVDAISPPKVPLDRRVFEPWIELQIDNAATLETVSGLDSARVLSVSPSAMRLLEFLDQPKTFGELRSGFSEEDGDDRWRQELLHVVRKIANGRLFDPIQAVVHIEASQQKGKIYRPVLCAIDRLGRTGPIQAFHLAFIEEVSPIDSTGMPREVAVVASMLRVAFRFRWEVLEKYGRRLLNEEEVERLNNCFERINRDWESRGITSQNEILSVFTEAQREHINSMFVEWRKLRNREGTGELDVAIRNKDTQRIHDLMQPVIPMCENFLKLATDRFVELVTRK